VPGYIRFIRSLSPFALNHAAHDTTVLKHIAGNALSILNGDHDGRAYAQNLIDECSAYYTTRVLVAEHFRRLGFWHVRYPRKPNMEPSTVFRADHPLTCLLVGENDETKHDISKRILRSGTPFPLLEFAKRKLSRSEMLVLLDEMEAARIRAQYANQGTVRYGRPPHTPQVRAELLEFAREGRQMLAEARELGLPLLGRRDMRAQLLKWERRFRALEIEKDAAWQVALKRWERENGISAESRGSDE